jgi:hypothetical protein
MARELKVIGLMNVRYAVKDETRLRDGSQPARLSHRSFREQSHCTLSSVNRCLEKNRLRCQNVQEYH